MLSKLFDHTAEIYKPSKTKGRLRDTTTSYVLDSSDKCAVVPFKESRRNIGPGEEIVANMQAFFPASSSISENDMVKLVSGPEAPSKWRVIGVIRPRNHHAEVTLERDEDIDA